MGKFRSLILRTARIFKSRCPCAGRRLPLHIDRAALLLAACLSASCLGASPTRPAEVSPAATEQLEALAGFTGNLRGIEAAEREQVYRELLVNLDAEPLTVDKALRMAILLSDPRTPYYAPSEALTLLDNASAANALNNTGQTMLVRFLRHLLSEYEEVHERHRHEIEALRAALLTEQLLRFDLEEQLDALKAVEQQIAIDDGVTP
jgi:hypothetical protein